MKSRNKNESLCAVTVYKDSDTATKRFEQNKRAIMRNRTNKMVNERFSYVLNSHFLAGRI